MLLLEQLPVGVFVGTAADGITSCNRQALEILGFPTWDALRETGRTPDDFLHPCDPETRKPFPPEDEPYFRALQGEAAQREVLYRNRATGRETVVECGAVPVRSVAGEVVAALVVLTDVTARWNAQQADRQRAEELRVFLDASPEIAWASSPEGDIAFYNERFFAYTGLSAKDATADLWARIVHPEDLSACLASRDTALASSTVWEQEFRLRRHDGVYRWFLGRAVPVRDTGSTSVRIWLGICTDIEDRKHDEMLLRETADALRASADALRASEERFRLASEAVGAILYDWDRSTGLVTRVGGMEEVLGFAPGEDEPSAEWWFARAHPDDIASMEAAGREAAAGNADRSLSEYRVRHRDGSWRWFLARDTVSEWDAEGNPRRIVGTAQDITERKQIEQELRASEARFRAVQETSPDGFMVLESVRDAAGQITDFRWTYVNQAATRILGRPAEAFLGKLLLQEMPGNREEGLFDVYVQVVESGEPWQSEFTYPHDGVNVYLRTTAAKVGDGFAVAFADLSERRRAEVALAESEERYRTLFESMEEGFFVIGLTFNEQGVATDSQFLEANPAFERLTGFTDVVGKSIRELVPDLEDVWFENYARVARTGVSARFEEYAAPLHRWYEVHAFPIGAPEQHRVAVIFNDVSRRKRSEEELRAATEALEAIYATAPIGLCLLDTELRRYGLTSVLRKSTGIRQQITSAKPFRNCCRGLPIKRYPHYGAFSKPGNRHSISKSPVRLRHNRGLFAPGWKAGFPLKTQRATSSD
ncbi:MAG: hypothetical protein OHK0029_13520 [Armatimonadaceae bacterium]